MKKTIIVTPGENASKLNIVIAVRDALDCSVREARDLVSENETFSLEIDEHRVTEICDKFTDICCKVKIDSETATKETKELRSTATFHKENGYAEFSTFFRVVFTKNADAVFVKTPTEDIIGTFADTIIRALNLRMDSCVSMLMRNYDRVTFANERCIQFKKANGQLHTFDRESFVYMESAITMLQEGRIGKIIETPGICRQIAKALYWVPEEDKKERNGIGFGRLVSVMISLC